MSLSWTKLLSTAPSAQAGIAIGRNQVCAAVLGPEAGNHQMRSLQVQGMSQQLFSGPPSAASEAALTDALYVVSEGFRSEFAAVRVALPDTVIRSTVFDLDELPKTEELRGALLRWRFAMEWQCPEESIDCRGLDMGEDCGKKVLYGQAGDRAWLDCVRSALARAGIVPWSLNSAAVCRFNCFHDHVSGSGGALLSLDQDCWNLQLWDASGRVRRVLTRLCGAGTAENEAGSIADAVERAILAYVQGDGARKVDRLYLAGSETVMTSLAAEFVGRLREEAVLLRADEKVTGALSGMREGLAPLALAAALDI